MILAGYFPCKFTLLGKTIINSIILDHWQIHRFRLKTNSVQRNGSQSSFCNLHLTLNTFHKIDCKWVVLPSCPSSPRESWEASENLDEVIRSFYLLQLLTWLWWNAHTWASLLCWPKRASVISIHIFSQVVAFLQKTEDITHTQLVALLRPFCRLRCHVALGVQLTNIFVPHVREFLWKTTGVSKGLGHRDQGWLRLHESGYEARRLRHSTLARTDQKHSSHTCLRNIFMI